MTICGFAFEPLAGKEASTLGRLTILQARMNPDLAMGDELLTAAGWQPPSPTKPRSR